MRSLGSVKRPGGKEPAFSDSKVEIYIEDALEASAELQPGSVHTIVTSPPYFSLRSYLDSSHPSKGREIGTEPTVEEYVANLVAVFDALAPALREDGTLWVVIGDTYAQREIRHRDGRSEGRSRPRQADALGETGRKVDLEANGIKPKDLYMVPARLAIALQEAGWYLRNDIIWQKINGLPDPATDRFARSHEHILFLSKRERYFFDAEAVREPSTPDSVKRAASGHTRGGKLEGRDESRGDRDRLASMREISASGRSRRDVISTTLEPYSGAHFAAFPREIARIPVLAATSERGVCPECGAPWRRVVERGDPGRDWRDTDTPRAMVGGSSQRSEGTAANVGEQARPTRTAGWEPGCACAKSSESDHLEPVPAIVLDPFCGSGTTLEVARSHSRRAVGFDIDERSARHLERRLGSQDVLF